MMLKDLKLGLENVVADPSKPTVQVVSWKFDKKFSSDVIVGYQLEIAARKCSRCTVKIVMGDAVKQNIEALDPLLRKQDFVEVMLTNPVVRPYALISSGNLISGVSIKADGFEIQDDEKDLLK